MTVDQWQQAEAIRAHKHRELRDLLERVARTNVAPPRLQHEPRDDVRAAWGRVSDLLDALQGGEPPHHLGGYVDYARDALGAVRRLGAGRVPPPLAKMAGALEDGVGAMTELMDMEDDLVALRARAAGEGDEDGGGAPWAY